MTVWRDIARSVWGASLFAAFQGRGMALYRTDWTWVLLSYVLSSLVTGGLWIATELPDALDGVDSSWASALLFPVLLDVVAVLVGIPYRFGARWRLFFVNYSWLSVPVYVIGLVFFPIPPFAWEAAPAVHDGLATLFLVYYLALTWFQIRRPLDTSFVRTSGIFAAFVAVIVADSLLAWPS